MSGEKIPHLRIVGGNDRIVRMARASREARWPPLRLVGLEDFTETAQPAVAQASGLASPVRRASAHARDGWSQALLAGLVVVMLSSVGQAIAAHW